MTLECSALGGPGNTFTWTHVPTGQEISSNQFVTVQVASGLDGGTYRCLVENEAGSGMAESTIFGNDTYSALPWSCGGSLTLVSCCSYSFIRSVPSLQQCSTWR